MLSIGELSKRTGVKVPTIRYYEQMGLIREADRSEGNQRRYEKSDLERLAFIRHARDLGLNIDAIRELIALSQHREMPCEGADRIAAEHLADVRENRQPEEAGTRTGADRLPLPRPFHRGLLCHPRAFRSRHVRG